MYFIVIATALDGHNITACLYCYFNVPISFSLV